MRNVLDLFHKCEKTLDIGKIVKELSLPDSPLQFETDSATKARVIRLHTHKNKNTYKEQKIV